MQILPNTTGSDCKSSLFSAIESAPGVIQRGWDDQSATPEGHKSIIDAANKSINLADYLQTKLNLESTNSSSGWIYKAPCPFHKHGQERTASFFINTEQNRFYCQACNISGGISEYIAFSYKRSPILVAEHILNCVNGSFQISEADTKKVNDKRKFQSSWLKLSELYRSFAKSHIDDDAAIEYANKCFCGLDNVIEDNQDAVEKSIDEILYRFELYLKKYDER
jgi:hypothetical protein